jgi:hypothetical protein
VNLVQQLNRDVERSEDIQRDTPAIVLAVDVENRQHDQVSENKIRRMVFGDPYG